MVLCAWHFETKDCYFTKCNMVVLTLVSMVTRLGVVVLLCLGIVLVIVLMCYELQGPSQYHLSGLVPHIRLTKI